MVGWAFSLPFLVIFLVFLGGPILAAFLLSFTGFNIGNLQDWFGADWLGFGNYSDAFADERFQKAARNTAVFVLFGVPLTLALGLLAALGLNQAIGRVQAVFRVGYYLPVVTSIVAIAVIWRYLLHPDYGLVNTMLAQVGIDGPAWLARTDTALGSIIALGVWRNFGFDMVIFLAALQGIDRQLYEAARVDGASASTIFWRITLPLLKPAVLFLAVITSSGYLQLFEEPFVMTGGGPLNSTLSVSMMVYEEGFRFVKFGYASAIAYLLFVAIAVLAFMQFRLLRSEEAG
ncbi:MAG: sugar ABC transporter permease [Actinobacteria bacterium]|nr:sugar ABC transporter permease [Actinomycetota bacterium]